MPPPCVLLAACLLDLASTSYEINPCVLALLDWASYWVKDHTGTHGPPPPTAANSLVNVCTGRVFEPIVYESYKRIRDGYEARQVTKALWTTSMMVIPEVRACCACRAGES